MKFFIETLIKSQAENSQRKCEDALTLKEENDFLMAGVIDGEGAIGSVIPSVKDQGGYFAAQFIKKTLERNFPKIASTKDLLAYTNQNLRNHLKNIGIDPDKSQPLNLTGAEMTLIIVDKNQKTIEITQAGDTVCLLEYKTGLVKLAVTRSETLFDEQALKLAKRLSRARNMDFKNVLFNNKEIGDILIQSRNSNNSPDGCGIAAVNGMTNFETFYLKSDFFAIHGLNLIILLTDGMLLPQQEIGAIPDWKMIANIVKQDGLEGLSQKVLNLKNFDPEFNKYPRFKKHDDMAGILIKINY